MSNPSLSGFRPSALHEQRFHVEFDYPVVFCRGALTPREPSLAWAITRREPQRRQPVFAVLDAGLVAARPALAQELERYFEAYSDHLSLSAAPHVLVGGEDSKNDPRLITDLHERMAAARLDKQGTLLVIGGGAVLDAAGFAGSTTHRGVRIVRMPSTVLAQNDAGVGVKTSVNAFSSKNFLGTFAPPFAVVNDADLLSTLPVRDVRAGLAEAVKVALIRDVSFFDWLEQHSGALREAEPMPLELAVRRCAELHLQHIATGGDPFERGSARPLDYGHWAAHKLETLTHHALRHGEAVAIGMALDACYAVEKGILPAAARDRLCALLRALGLPTYHAMLKAEHGGKSLVLRGLEEFREHLGGALTVTLLSAIGRGEEVTEMDFAAIAKAINWLEAAQAG
ncbi:MAG TPA: 3-dehydroquinate synthase [Polyangiaceae bacterium]